MTTLTYANLCRLAELIAAVFSCSTVSVLQARRRLGLAPNYKGHRTSRPVPEPPKPPKPQPAPIPGAGCVCPVGAEVNCGSSMCPRRRPVWTVGTTEVTG